MYAINDTQKVLDGLGTLNVPHRKTIKGIGKASKLCDLTMLMNTSK